MDLKDFTTYQACILQARAYRVLRDFVAKQLDGHGLTMMEWVLLGIVEEAGTIGISPSMLSERLDVSLPMVTRMVDGVVKHGYVARRASEHDKRQQTIVTTPEGSMHAKAIERKMRSAMKNWLKDIDRVELLGYVRTMSLIADMEHPVEKTL